MHVIFAHPHLQAKIAMNVKEDGTAKNAMYAIPDTLVPTVMFVPLAGYQRQICLALYVENVSRDTGEVIVRHVETVRNMIL